MARAACCRRGGDCRTDGELGFSRTRGRQMRVASVSFWHLHGTDYATDAQNNPGVDLVGVWDDDPERGRAGAAKHGIPFVEDLDEILDDPSIEGVIVCSPTSEHVPLVTRC